jgi:hypothetical protein
VTERKKPNFFHHIEDGKSLRSKVRIASGSCCPAEAISVYERSNSLGP